MAKINGSQDTGTIYLPMGFELALERESMLYEHLLLAELCSWLAGKVQFLLLLILLVFFPQQKKFCEGSSSHFSWLLISASVAMPQMCYTCYH